MPIKNKTDLATIQDYMSKPSIRVYKGTAKRRSGQKAIFGADLGYYYRIETGNQKLSDELIRRYSSKEEQKKVRDYARSLGGEKWTIDVSDTAVFLRELNIYLAHEHYEKAYDSYMGRFSLKSDKISGLIHRCDGETIYLEYKPVETVGGTYKEASSCNKQCANLGKVGKCPLGCTAVGQLYFYICDFYHMGYRNLCSLSAAGETDARDISGYLYREVYEKRSSCNKADHSFQTEGFIPFKLFRQQEKINRPIMNGKGNRTGKSQEGIAYAVKLSINPEWLAWEKQHNTVSKALEAGYRPEMKVLSEVYQVDLIAPGESAQLLLPGEKWQAGEAEKQQIRKIYLEMGWSKVGCLRMLKDRFQINDFDHIYNLSESGFSFLVENLSSPSAVAKYNASVETVDAF